MSATSNVLLTLTIDSAVSQLEVACTNIQEQLEMQEYSLMLSKFSYNTELQLGLCLIVQNTVSHETDPQYAMTETNKRKVKKV